MTSLGLRASRQLLAAKHYSELLILEREGNMWYVPKSAMILVLCILCAIFVLGLSPGTSPAWGVAATQPSGPASTMTLTSTAPARRGMDVRTYCDAMMALNKPKLPTPSSAVFGARVREQSMADFPGTAQRPRLGIVEYPGETSEPSVVLKRAHWLDVTTYSSPQKDPDGLWPVDRLPLFEVIVDGVVIVSTPCDFRGGYDGESTFWGTVRVTWSAPSPRNKVVTLRFLWETGVGRSYSWQYRVDETFKQREVEDFFGAALPASAVLANAASISNVDTISGLVFDRTVLAQIEVPAGDAYLVSFVNTLTKQAFEGSGSLARRDDVFKADIGWWDAIQNGKLPC